MFVGCGKCSECRRQKAQSWRIRLIEEMKVQKYYYFITLTFDEESLKIVQSKGKTENEQTKYAIRHFLERYRKKFSKSLRHWLINELGHENTERLHIHGIIFRDEPMTKEMLQEWWKYGRVDIGKFCNLQTINYIVKYVTKIDKDHKDFNSKVFCSPGIGKNWLQTPTAKTYKYRPTESKEYYTLPNGRKVTLPLYYKNHLYSETERIKIWTDKLDKGETYVNGIFIQNGNGSAEHYQVLMTQQQLDQEAGYDKPEIHICKSEKYTFIPKNH